MARKRYTPEQIIIKLMEIVNLKNRFIWMGLFFYIITARHENIAENQSSCVLWPILHPT